MSSHGFGFVSSGNSLSARKGLVALVSVLGLLASTLALGAPLKGQLANALDSKVEGLKGLVGQAGDQLKAKQVAAKLPIVFEENRGQTDPKVKFMARSAGSTLFLTQSEAVLRVKEDVVRMKLEGANPTPVMSGVDRLDSKSNYFTGSDSSKWHSDISNFNKVLYEGVYPGIDMVYYGSQKQLEYDFIVAPRADPRQIRMDFGGAKALKIDQQGNLVLNLEGGNLVHRAPVAYQEEGSAQKKVSVSFVIRDKSVHFELGKYDPDIPLTIDPIIYSSYLGGSAEDVGRSITVDPACSIDCPIYITGRTLSADFPVQNALDSTCGTAPNCNIDRTGTNGISDGTTTYTKAVGGETTFLSSDVGKTITGTFIQAGTTITARNSATSITLSQPTTDSGSGLTFTVLNSGSVADVYIAKLNATKDVLLFSTYLGGASVDNPSAIRVDSGGNVYVVGTTSSTDFPTLGPVECTAGPPQITTSLRCDQPADDGFLTKLNSTGSAIVYSTYLGGGSTDTLEALWVEPTSGSAYLLGQANSTDMPVTPGAYREAIQVTLRDVYLAKLNSSGTTVDYGTYYGGSTGFLNGSDVPYALEVDAAGRAYFGGRTTSTNLPGTSGKFQPAFGGGTDLFAAKINPDPSDGTPDAVGDDSDLEYATYLGGSSSESDGTAMDIDIEPSCLSNCNLYVLGSTQSANYPVTPGAFQTAGLTPNATLSLTKLNSSGTGPAIYSTFLGGNVTEIAHSLEVDFSGNAYVMGIHSNGGTGQYPTASPVQFRQLASRDVVLTKVNPSGNGLVYSTYLGGSVNDGEQSIDTARGALVLEGTKPILHNYTQSTDFPVSAGALDASLGGVTDAFITEYTSAAKERLGDFNAQGTTDLSIYRNGVWYLNDRAPAPRPAFNVAYSWGGDPADKIVPGDYNGDGLADTAVYRNGIWYVNHRQGLPGDIQAYSWGGDPSDVPAPGDYDGDGDTDLAVYRAGTGTWYINRNEGLPSDISQHQWGGDGTDKAVPGDYDKDGDTDIAVYRTGTGYWYVMDQPALETQWGGDGTDKAVPGDFDGDGDWDFAVYRTSTGYWYVKDQPALEGQWGGDGTDLPVPGDYNRDGKSDIAVYRKGTGTWYVKGQFEQSWGGDGADVPVPLPVAMR